MTAMTILSLPSHYIVRSPALMICIAYVNAIVSFLLLAANICTICFVIDYVQKNHERTKRAKICTILLLCNELCNYVKLQSTED